jgi:hypothetical protein
MCLASLSLSICEHATVIALYTLIYQWFDFYFVHIFVTLGMFEYAVKREVWVVIWWV